MKKNNDITIWSLGDIARAITEKRTGFNIVSIRSSDAPTGTYDDFEKHRHNYRDIIIECFDDLRFPEEGFITPSHEHIRRILKWAKGKERIAVHCTAGISRSSAVAYLIACQRVSPKKAVKILDPAKHCPNKIVLEIGKEIFKDESICTEYAEWFEKSYVNFP